MLSDGVGATQKGKFQVPNTWRRATCPACRELCHIRQMLSSSIITRPWVRRNAELTSCSSRNRSGPLRHDATKTSFNRRHVTPRRLDTFLPISRLSSASLWTPLPPPTDQPIPSELHSMSSRPPPKRQRVNPSHGQSAASKDKLHHEDWGECHICPTTTAPTSADPPRFNNHNPKVAATTAGK